MQSWIRRVLGQRRREEDREELLPCSSQPECGWVSFFIYNMTGDFSSGKSLISRRYFDRLPSLLLADAGGE